MEPESELTSLRKLLSSHLSIYNALNNPDLDGSQIAREGTPITRRATPRLSPSPMVAKHDDKHEGPQSSSPEIPEFSIASWQAINNQDWYSMYESRKSTRSPNIPQLTRRGFTPPTSILSITTDEDADPLKENVVAGKTMVFETDEEDEDFDAYETFVMPVMSVSESSQQHKSFHISVLTLNPLYKFETKQLIKDIESSLDYNVRIQHFNVNNPLRLEKTAVVDSDLVFIVNDGSKTLVDYLTKVFPTEKMPKLTIINMMTVNYFINLFDLINNLEPYQIWKTSSLKHHKLVNKLKDFIEVEANLLDPNRQVAKKNKNLSLTLARESPRNRTMYSTIISSKKTNYKSIEKNFKLDLNASSCFEDPLQISNRFLHLQAIYVVLKKVLTGLVDKGESILSSRAWLVCSFSVGIGIGVLVSMGAKSAFEQFFHEGLTEHHEIAKFTPPEPPGDLIDLTIEYAMGVVNEIANLPIVVTLEGLIKKGMQKVMYANSLALTGLEKIFGLMMYGDL